MYHPLHKYASKQLFGTKRGAFAQKLPGILPSVSLKFLAAQGKSAGDGVFARFAAKE
jgi:hypothetical protein